MFSLKLSTECLIFCKFLLTMSSSIQFCIEIDVFVKIFPKILLAKIDRVPGKSYAFLYNIHLCNGHTENSMFLSFLFLKYYQEVESEVINCFFVTSPPTLLPASRSYPTARMTLKNVGICDNRLLRICPVLQYLDICPVWYIEYHLHYKCNESSGEDKYWIHEYGHRS